MSMDASSASPPRHTRTDVVSAYRRLRTQDPSAEVTVERILQLLGPSQTSPTTIASTLRVASAISNLVERGVVAGPERVSVARLRREFPDLSFSNTSAQEIIDALSERDTERVEDDESATMERNQEGGSQPPPRDALVQDLAQIIQLPQTQLVELSNVAQRHLREAVDEERQAGDKRLQAQAAAAQAVLAEERRLLEQRLAAQRADHASLAEARLAATRATMRMGIVVAAVIAVVCGAILGAWAWSRLSPAIPGGGQAPLVPPVVTAPPAPASTQPAAAPPAAVVPVPTPVPAAQDPPTTAPPDSTPQP